VSPPKLQALLALLLQLARQQHPSLPVLMLLQIAGCGTGCTAVSHPHSSSSSSSLRPSELGQLAAVHHLPQCWSHSWSPGPLLLVCLQAHNSSSSSSSSSKNAG
jgi:hypothetical protein